MKMGFHLKLMYVGFAKNENIQITGITIRLALLLLILPYIDHLLI